MVKVINPISKSSKPTKKFQPTTTKKYVFLEEYKDLLTFRMKPVSEAFIERLSEEYMAWAKKEDSLILSDFCDERHIEPRSFYNWCQKFDSMRDAHDYAKRRIASRRELGALNRKFSETMVIRRQHAYDPEWDKDKQRDKQDKIDIAIAVKKAAMEMGDNKPQVIVLSELEFKKQEVLE